MRCGVVWYMTCIINLHKFQKNYLEIIVRKKRSIIYSFFFNFLFKYIFFFYLRKLHLPESALCGPRWASKTPAVSDFYKRCTSWLELETYCANLKSCIITLRHLDTLFFSNCNTRTTKMLSIHTQSHSAPKQYLQPAAVWPQTHFTPAGMSNHRNNMTPIPVFFPPSFFY
jgi:hypothetical protein